MVDIEVDRIIAVGQAIEIAQQLEGTPERSTVYPSWGPNWVHQYFGDDRPLERMPAEIHSPWGMMVVDPHWSDLQAYEKAIPLWPRHPQPGLSTTTTTNYRIPGSEESMPWQTTMHVNRWESITVPAGRFTALRYSNLINLRYTNVSGRIAGQRKETVWFVPQIGRWVARESAGTFRQDVAEEFNESSFRWELLSWS